MFSTGQRPVTPQCAHKEWKWEVVGKTKSFPLFERSSCSEGGQKSGQQAGNRGFILTFLFDTCDPPPLFFLKRAVHQLPFTHLKGDSYWLPTVGEEWRREREKPRQWKERDRETRRYRGSFCCWRKSRVTMKQKMGPAATSLALLCLCSLGVCVPMGTGSAAPAQVRTSYAVCALSIRGCSHCRAFS